MKRAIVAILMFALPAFGRDYGVMYLAKDFQKTEDIINNILNESSDGKPADTKQTIPADAAGIDKKESAPPAGEKKTTPDVIPAGIKRMLPRSRKARPR